MSATKATTKKNSKGIKDRRDWKVNFLVALTHSPSVTHAAEMAGIDRSTAYREYNINPEFAEMWDNAINESIERAEHELYRRAVEGVDKPIAIAGEREIVKEYSDTLLIFFLKTRKPDVYRDISTVNTNVKIGKLNEDELRQFIEQRLARIGLGAGRSGETGDESQSTVIVDNPADQEVKAEND